ncbi:hypothetical protein POM88_025526 [Heracleum sosnowskyi]|uniref:F-box domain-containing protein n=1 Tax=Heracleum sosnowskyi TaxID=360622 RepID=A0AAD8MN04_9APIA|nr:hypothetical protein POM88_025526 [Heracleum sosnowskyi]
MKEHVDLISTLPDDLLCRIITLLPSKDGIRTSILSSRWKTLMDFVPILDIACDVPTPGFVNTMDRHWIGVTSLKLDDLPLTGVTLLTKFLQSAPNLKVVVVTIQPEVQYASRINVIARRRHRHLQRLAMKKEKNSACLKPSPEPYNWKPPDTPLVYTDVVDINETPKAKKLKKQIFSSSD